VAIARSLASNPRLIVLDEPTSALDVSVGAKILRLLQDIQQRLGTAYLFVSHDLAVIRQMADEVAVMRAGRIVETAPCVELLDHPREDYTRKLLASVLPLPKERSKTRTTWSRPSAEMPSTDTAMPTGPDSRPVAS